jgi:hypothetical protein
MPIVTVTEPAILVRIAQLYNDRMSAQALYEATRGVWRIGERRSRAHFALSVAGGIVHEVYAIHQWHPAGTTQYKTRPAKDVQRSGRWEFTGRVAPEPVRAKYVDKSVAHYFERGATNPIMYVNAEPAA